MEKSELKKMSNDLSEIYEQGIVFFKQSSILLANKSFWGQHSRNEFWQLLDETLQQKAQAVVAKIIRLAPLISESAKLTSYLTETDQIDLGHAIKSLRSSLYLCRYQYWGPEILHDEGTVWGIQPAGQSNDEGVHPDTALQIFEEYYDKLCSIVDLVSPLTAETAGNIITCSGQKSTIMQPDIAFIMMWMDPIKPELEDIYLLVKKSFRKFGITAERADDIEHSGKITEAITNKIRSSEFLFADLTGARPNVYYEVGFAHALNRKVILYRKSEEPIHFDLAGYNCPEYKNITDLEKKLCNRLESMTGRKIRIKQRK